MPPAAPSTASPPPPVRPEAVPSVVPLEATSTPPKTVEAEPVAAWGVETHDGRTFVHARVCADVRPLGSTWMRVWTPQGLGVAELDHSPQLSCFVAAIPLTTVPDVLEGVILVPQLFGGGHRVTFSVPLGAEGHQDNQARSAYLQALAGYYRSVRDGGSAFAAFAEERLTSLRGESPSPADAPEEDAWAEPWSFEEEEDEPPLKQLNRGRQAAELDAGLVGLDGVYSAMGILPQTYLGASSSTQRTLPLGEGLETGVPSPPAVDYDMLLNEAGPVKPLDFAEGVPSTHYLLAVRDTTDVDRVVDLASRVLSAGQGASTLVPWLRSAGLDLASLRELRGEVASRFAITGSDLFVTSGSDMTLVIDTPAPRELNGVLERARDRMGLKITKEGLKVGGMDATAWRSADGRVHQFVVRFEGLTYVSNSGAALSAHLDVRRGQAPSLQAQSDVRWLSTHLEPSETDGFFVLGRGFVERTTGQAVRTLHMRRQALLFELRRPGYAELLFRQVRGRAPSDAKELLAAGYLTAEDLVHHDGEPIRWEPGQRARSAHGTQERLSPALGKPLPKRVSPRERDAYLSFRRGYLGQFTGTDPVLLTAHLDPEEKRLKVSLVQQPAARTSKWLSELLGAYVDVRGPSANTEMPSQPVAGARLAVSLPAELQGLFGPLPPGHWLAVGVRDRPGLLRLADADSYGKPNHETTLATRLRGAPVYVALNTPSPAAATAAFMYAKATLERWVPHMVWSQRNHAGVLVHHARIGKRDADDDPAGAESVVMEVSDELEGVEVHVAMVGDALLVSLAGGVLDGVIDDALAGRLPRAKPGKEAPARGTLDLALEPDGALVQVMAYEQLTRPEAVRAQRIDAEAVLVAHPDDAERLAALTLGYGPATREGRRYRLSPDGVFDPTWGTPNHPRFPRLPVAGSALEHLVRTVSRIHARASLDDAQSILRVDADLRLRD